MLLFVVYLEFRDFLRGFDDSETLTRRRAGGRVGDTVTWKADLCGRLFRLVAVWLRCTAFGDTWKWDCRTRSGVEADDRMDQELFIGHSEMGTTWETIYILRWDGPGRQADRDSDRIGYDEIVVGEHFFLLQRICHLTNIPWQKSTDRSVGSVFHFPGHSTSDWGTDQLQLDPII